MLTILLISILVALLISFLCSLSEAVLLSLTPGQVAELSARQPRIGKIWQGFKADVKQPITVILILNTAAHTVGAASAGAQFAQLFGVGWIWLFSLAFTYAMLQWTEILPKTLGVRFNYSLAGRIAVPLTVGVRIFTPVIHLVDWVNRPFQPRAKQAPQRTTLDEIVSLAAMARLGDQLGQHQERIIRGAARLTGSKAREVMIPRAQVATISTSHSVSDALALAQIDAHTRFPVADGNDPARIVGYLNFKEVVYQSREQPSEQSFAKIIRPIRHVAPETPVTEVLKVFVDQHEHIAVVVDPAGQCLGLITLEDIVEELVGELQSEFDRLPVHFQQLPGGTWLVGGGVTLSDLATRLGNRVPAPGTSLAAWLERELGAPPRPGANLTRDGLKIQVRRVRRGRVFEATVERAVPGS